MSLPPHGEEKNHKLVDGVLPEKMASTRDNQVTDLIIEGQPVVIGVNAYKWLGHNADESTGNLSTRRPNLPMGDHGTLTLPTDR